MHAKLLKGLAILSILALLAAAVFMWMSNLLREDSCLDSGGRWDHERRACEQ